MHSDVSERIDITNVFQYGYSPVISYNPEYPFRFEVTATNNQNIAKMYVTSTKGEEVRYLEATYYPNTGTWVATGYFEESNTGYVPGSLNIVIIPSGEDMPDELTDPEGFEKALKDKVAFSDAGSIRFIIDPSGHVYEAVMGNPVQGVTATIYYQDPETGEAVKWDSTDNEQDNPLLTNHEGAYAWDVPEGL